MNVLKKKKKKQTESKGRVPRTALVPGFAYFILFFILPMILLVRYSLSTTTVGSGKINGDFTLQNYIMFFTDSYFIKVFFRSLKLSFLLCLITIIFAYPVGYYLARSKSKIVPLVSGMTYLPLLASTVVTSFGWMIILSDQGIVNKFLLDLGIIHKAVKIMYTEKAVLIALTQASLPYMITSIRNVIFTIDKSIEEAAGTLGARGPQVFFTVTLPLSLPGIAAGSLLVFVTGMSAFVTPELLGGGQVATLATILLRETQTNLNFPLASTIAIIVTCITSIIIFLYNKALESDLLGGGGRK